MRLSQIRFAVRPPLIILGMLAIVGTGYLALDRYSRRNADLRAEEQRRLAAAYFSRPEVKELASRRPREVFSERGIAILRGATRVETFRIDSTAPYRSEEIDGHPILAKGREQGPNFASRLAGRLLDGRIYCFQDSFCDPTPGMAFRLWMGRESVDLLVCYECDHVEVFVRDASGQLTHHGDYQFGGPIEGPEVLPDLAKEAFPTDPLIQKL